jgi:predicted esterase
MCGNNSGQTHDGAWWRTWWVKNSSRFRADVRDIPITRVALRPRTPLAPISRGPEQHQIAGDFKRTYWLISPSGFIRSQHIAPPAPPRLSIAGNARDAAIPAIIQGDETPGLLVVLPPDGNGANAALFWQQMEDKALKNRTYIAVATAPKWSETQTATWLTVENAKQVKEAKFTTEKFAAEIVQDVMASHTIQPNRTYLHGAAESGPAAYACSLDETTPFKGFYILASAFKSASLPPLSRARNRRYFIQHSTDDKTAPFVMAAAAQKLLAEQGAAAKLASYKGSHGYVFSDPAADPIGDAISWLDGTQK